MLQRPVLEHRLKAVLLLPHVPQLSGEMYFYAGAAAISSLNSLIRHLKLSSACRAEGLQYVDMPLERNEEEDRA